VDNAIGLSMNTIGGLGALLLIYDDRYVVFICSLIVSCKNKHGWDNRICSASRKIGLRAPILPKVLSNKGESIIF
jgi:hypothetical protein